MRPGRLVRAHYPRRPRITLAVAGRTPRQIKNASAACSTSIPKPSDTAQAASAYLFAYYVGSSVAGTAAGSAWSTGGWSGVLLLTGTLVVLAWLVTLALARSTSLLRPGPAADRAR